MLGRPRKTNESTDRKMILARKRNRFSSYSVISSSFNVSRETLRRRANEFGFKSGVAVINPLTKCNKLKRKIWCKSHLNENFSSYIFSDEFKIERLLLPKTSTCASNVIRKICSMLRTLPRILKNGKFDGLGLYN